MPDKSPPRSPFTILAALLLVAGVLVALADRAARAVLARAEKQGGLAPSERPLARAVNAYLSAKYHVLDHAIAYGALALLGPPLLYLALRRLAAGANRWREEFTGMALRQPSYALPNPFAASGTDDTANRIAAAQQAFTSTLFAPATTETATTVEPAPPPDRVLLGFDEHGTPVHLSDHARTMHVHVLGQTGSGKTQAVLYPLLFQDARRGWPVVFLDAKGSMENEDTLAAIAQATGRTDDLRIFTLNPQRPTHTYNPMHLAPRADPRAVAERVFATFEKDLDVQYYKDMARELWVNLVCALASTGQPMTMLDLAACIANPGVLAHALSLASDRKAIRSIQSRYDQLGRKVGETYTGLLAAVLRYDHPAINTYDPDIRLEEAVDGTGLVGFFLPANAYKFQARAIGLVVLQHLQELGAHRQMDRSRSQALVAVYADEFYTFAYDGFVDAVNKLRDARIALLLSHQSLSDLDRVSPEFARGVWDNTRTKIVLFQSDADLCERLASAAGTRRQIELTVRRNVDGFLNNASALEASSREVDEFVLHPNRIKHLSVGQCYLVQTGIADGAVGRSERWWRRRQPAASATRVVGVNLAPLPALPLAGPISPRPTTAVRGLGLHDLFVSQGVRR